MPTGAKAKPSRVRLLQGAIFMIGAVALAVLVGGGALSFSWTPALLGAIYLAAALAGGRDGGHWSTACVLLGWGTAVLLESEGVIARGRRRSISPARGSVAWSPRSSSVVGSAPTLWG